MKSLLINWVYYRPIGHVIEAMRAARDFAAGDDQLSISLLLNQESPVELARCLPEIEHVYSIDVGRASSPGRFPSDLPREWDYVFTDPRAGTEPASRDLERFHDAFRKWVRVKYPGVVPNRKFAPLRLRLPDEERRLAAAWLPESRSLRMSVLPGAGSNMRAPSTKFWTVLLDAFFDRHPEGEVIILGSLDRARNYTRGISEGDLAELARRFPRVRNAFDIGLLKQLALAERCGLHVSPHSGMSFAIQAVGVPWLALSGQEWHEFLLNGVPFVSVFPDCPLYPCFREMYADCRARMRNQVRTPCIEDHALFLKLPEIIAGMEALLAGTVPYHLAARNHAEALRKRGVPDDWSIVDWPAVIADDYVF